MSYYDMYLNKIYELCSARKDTPKNGLQRGCSPRYNPFFGIIPLQLRNL